MINLQDYDISTDTGFVPSQFPLTELPNPYYKPWETLAANLPALILNRTIRRLIDENLPILSTAKLATKQEYQRAYVVLSFLTHAYVWGYNDQPCKVLPQQLAIPYKQVAQWLDMPPVATYAAVVLWNFKRALPLSLDFGSASASASGNNSADSANDSVASTPLNNLATINTFTGSIDESWFYLVSCHFEIKGAKCLEVGLEALTAAVSNKPTLVISYLQQLAEHLDALGTLLMLMEEMCDPHVFYFRIRPFLAGWKNMKEFGLDADGLCYDDGLPESLLHPISYAGGSNAQSSLIQYFDTLLGVVHHPTGHRPHKVTNTVSNSSKSSTLKPTQSTINNSENNFMEQMKQYMPAPHRKFLSDLAQESSVLKKFVQLNNKEYPELTLAFDACLAMLKAFRDKHIQIVTRYIILPSRSANLSSNKTLRAGLANATASDPTKATSSSSSSSSKEPRGTGGTALLPFLKQCRDETGDPAAGSWGRRILSGGILNLKYTAGGELKLKWLQSSSSRPSASDLKKKGQQGTIIDGDGDTSGHW